MWDLFENGQSAKESAQKGYLDYEDPKMSQTVRSLVKLTPKYRSQLLKVLEFDSDPDKRAMAATLLNWALNTEDSISKVHNFVNDPSRLVRNNVSRFMLHYFGHVKDSKTRQDVISSLANQLWFPSHGDRNKAIYGLWEIAQSHPTERAFIKSRAIDGIEFLAKNSILNNVQVPAQQLLERNFRKLWIEDNNIAA